MKVVRMLQDMAKELETDLEDDKAVHAKLGCWCETNDKEKTTAIEMGEAKSAQLQASMGEDGAKIMDLKEKRKGTRAELYADEKALDEAEEMRMKDNKEFHAEETDLLEAVDACKQAIVVLSEQHPELTQVRSAVQKLHAARVAQLAVASGGLRRDQLEVLKSFLQRVDGASSFLAIPGFQSYAPQSGQIFGILKQMQKDFSDSLSDSQKAEEKSKSEFEMLKAAKLDEIASAKKSIAQIDSEVAALSEKHAQEAQELEDTENQLELDRAFLADLKKKCSESDAEFEARTKSRLEEIAAVEETIKMLNTDEAFNNFDKTVNTAFLQTSASSAREMDLRQRAASLLQEAAGRTGASALALIAASAQLDTFSKVKEAIDKLVVELNAQQLDEVKHRDWCIEELAVNDRETSKADDQKTSLEAKIADLTKTISSLDDDIKTTEAEVAELQTQMKRASETREATNADYQQTIVDQRLTQAILEKALARMKQVYALLQQGSAEEPEQPGAAHIATSGNHTNAGNGPVRFTKYEQNAGGSRVVQAIETIIADSKKMDDEAMASEEDAQTAYESFMKDANKSIIAHMKSLVDMKEARSKAKESLVLSETDHKQTMQELEGLSQTNGDLHKSCDFVMKNFDARQAARAAEVDALKDAKGILSGMA